MAAFGNFLDEVVRLFGSVGPLWLVLFLGTSVHAVFYRFVFLTLLSLPENFLFGHPSVPVPGNRNAGYAILFVLGLLKATWVGSWCMGMFITFFCDRHWESPTTAKVIMQAGRGKFMHFPQVSPSRLTLNVHPYSPSLLFILTLHPSFPSQISIPHFSS